MTPVAEGHRLEERAWKRGRNFIALAALGAWAASAAGWAADPKQFYASYLVAFAFLVTLAAGAMFFVMIHHLTGSVWSAPLRRLMENVMAAMPAAALLFVPIVVGIPTLYEWSHPEFYSDDPVLRVKMVFFNRWFFLARSAVYFLVWIVLARKVSVHAGARWSAPGLAALTITVTMASVDWLMSLEPHWYSTIFGIYVFSGAGLAFIALLALISLAFRRAGLLREAISVEHYHDLGRWLFALTIFWAYIAFSQYMLIWYANIPEETVWFKHRLEGNWIYISGALLAGHFMVPFLVLLTRAAKRSLPVLGAVSALVLAMHFVDLHWIVMPTVHHHGFHLHWLDAVTLAAVTSVGALVFWQRLREGV